MSNEDTNGTAKPPVDMDKVLLQRDRANELMRKAMQRMAREDIGPQTGMIAMLETALLGLLKLDAMRAQRQGVPINFDRAQHTVEVVFNEYATRLMNEAKFEADHQAMADADPHIVEEAKERMDKAEAHERMVNANRPRS